MKNLIIIVALVLLTSCSTSIVEHETGYNFDNSWYWFITVEEGTTDQEMRDYVDMMTNPEANSFFYFYPDNGLTRDMEGKSYALEDLARTVEKYPPIADYYVMMGQDEINEDASEMLHMFFVE